MRLGYLIPRLVIVGCVWAFFAFAFDPLLRWSVIGAGQALTGAKVEVEGLNTTFFPPSLAMRNVAVADPASPMTNLFEFEDLRFSIWGRPLLKQKFVVEEARLTGLEFGTARKTSGELPKPEPGSESGGVDLGLDGYFDAIGDQATGLGTAWLDDLVSRVKLELDPGQLASVQMVKTLESDWKQRLGDLEGRVKGLETRIDEIKRGVEDAKGDPLERIRAYQQAAVEARNLLDEAKAIRADLGQLGTKARGDFAQIEVVRQQDIATIKSKADLLKMDGGEISEALLGPTISGHLDTAGEWLAWVQKYASAISTPKPTRITGRIFEFPRPEDDLPNFLVRKLHLGGRFDLGGQNVPFEGIVTDITSEPKRLDRPMLVKLVSDGDAKIEVNAVLDQRPDVPVHDVTITFALPRPTELNVGDEGDDLRLAVTAARTDCKARFRIAGDKVDGRIAFVQTPVAVVSQAGEGIEKEVSRVLASTVGEVRELRCDVAIGGTFDAPEWSIESNLGPQLAAGLDNFLASELEARRTELVAKANALVDEKVGDLQAKLDGRFREVVAELDLEELNARNLIQQLAGGRLDTGKLNGILPTGGGNRGSVPQPVEDAKKRVGDELEKKLEEFNPFDRFRR